MYIKPQKFKIKSNLKLEILGPLNIKRLGSLNRATAKQGSDEALRSLKKLLVPNLPRKKNLHGPGTKFCGPHMFPSGQARGSGFLVISKILQLNIYVNRPFFKFFNLTMILVNKKRVFLLFCNEIQIYQKS